MGKYNQEHNDIYLLQCNLLEIQSEVDLKRVVALYFSVCSAELESRNDIFDFTLAGFKNLHRYLFQDI